MCIEDGRSFTALEPARQAEVLAAYAQHARLLEFALDDESDQAQSAASELRRAIEDAMDAGDSEWESARSALARALGDVYRSGLQLSARLGEVAVEGILGETRLSVLTTVLAPAGRA
jgi:hypothetical protein